MNQLLYSHTFDFVNDHPSTNVALHIIKTKLFEDIHVAITNFNQHNATIQHWIECYNMMREPDDDDPLDVNILEYEGTHVVEGFGIFSDQFLNPLKVKKVNIGSPENPKFVSIGDYYDNETVGKITDLLYEFQGLFPTKFSEMKGIVKDLGEMKIPLKPDTKYVKQRPYRLKPQYKEKVKKKLDRMLGTCIIEPVEESECRMNYTNLIG